MAWLLDTDTLSLLARGNPGICNRARQMPDSDLFVAIVSVEELLRGPLAKVRNAQDDKQIERAYAHLQATIKFARSVRIHPLDTGAIRRYNELRPQFRRQGTNDLRIAAIALENGCTVVTRNTRDFQDIPELQVENWAT